LSVSVTALFRLPDVPVIVTVAGATAAPVLAARVKVLVPVVLAGLNEAVTPVGRPEAVNATLPVNPFAGVTVRTVVPLPPCFTLNEMKEDVRPKLGASTVRFTAAALFKLPDVPVTVTAAGPGATELAALRVRVLVAVVLLGLNVAVTPLGRPEAVNATLPVNPFTGVTVMTLVTVAPGLIDTEAGAAVNVNSGCFPAPVRSSMRCCPLGVPQPVARSYPEIAGNPLLPVVMSCRSSG